MVSEQKNLTCVLYRNSDHLEQYCAWTKDHLNVQHYQGELGHSLHPITLNKFESYGSLHHTQNLYLPERPCSDPDMGALKSRGGCVHTRALKVDPKQVFGLFISTSWTIPFQAIFYKCIHPKLVFSNYGDRLPHPQHFFHSRRWCNENITLFMNA